MSDRGHSLFRLTAVAVLVAVLLPFLLAGCGDNTPEGIVRKHLEAYENHDWEAYKATLKPFELTKEQEELAKQKFESIKVEAEGLEMETSYDEKDDNRALVTLVDGKISYTLPVVGKEKTETEDIKNMEPEDRPMFDTVRLDGVWYVDKKPG